MPVPVPPPPPPDDYFKRSSRVGYTKTASGRTLKLIKRTFWNLISWHLPLVEIPLVPFLCVILSLFLLGLTFQNVQVLNVPTEGSDSGLDHGTTLWKVQYFKWFYYCAASLGLLICLTFVVSLILLIFQAIYFGTRLYYYINFTSIPLPFLIWSLVNIAAFNGEHVIFPSMDSRARMWISRVFIALFVVSLSYIPMR